MVDQTTDRPITLDHLVAMDARGAQVEIVNGAWAEAEEDSMTGELHGAIQAWLIFVLLGHVLPRGLGRVYPGDITFVLEGTPERIETRRRSDVSFVRADRVITSEQDNVYFHAPDLAIEIISPSETAEDMQHKLNDYLRAGVSQVWQIFPRTQQVIVTQSDGSAKTYSAEDTIPGGQLLPDLEISVKEIFTAQG